MTDQRRAKLFDGAISWVYEHTYESFPDARADTYVSALKTIGFTRDEAMEELMLEVACDNPITPIMNIYQPNEEINFHELATLVDLDDQRNDEHASWEDEDEDAFQHAYNQYGATLESILHVVM